MEAQLRAMTMACRPLRKRVPDRAAITQTSVTVSNLVTRVSYGRPVCDGPTRLLEDGQRFILRGRVRPSLMRSVEISDRQPWRLGHAS